MPSTAIMGGNPENWLKLTLLDSPDFHQGNNNQKKLFRNLVIHSFRFFFGIWYNYYSKTYNPSIVDNLT